MDLNEQRVQAGELELQFQVDPFARRCLLEGVDELGYLASFEARIAEYESVRGVTR